MKKLSFFFLILSLFVVSCGSDNEPLTIADQHTQTFSSFISGQSIVNQIPATLLSGNEAPFYLLDKERQIYMKVIVDNGEKLKEGQECYFRHSTYALIKSENGVKPILSTTNENEMGGRPGELHYSTQSDIPTLLPLRYVGNGSEVYLAIRQISDKTDSPLLMHIRYYPKGL